MNVFSFAIYDVNAMWKSFYNVVSAARIKNAIKQFPTRNNAWRLSISFRTTHSMSLNISAHYISSDPACGRWISINYLRLRDIIYVARAINHGWLCMLWMNASEISELLQSEHIRLKWRHWDDPMSSLVCDWQKHRQVGVLGSVTQNLFSEVLQWKISMPMC